MLDFHPTQGGFYNSELPFIMPKIWRKLKLKTRELESVQYVSSLIMTIPHVAVKITKQKFARIVAY